MERKFAQASLRLIALLSIAVAAVVFFLPAALGQTGPIITQQPASQTNLAGANLTLNVAVSGTGPFTYQWQFNGTNLPNDIITTVAGGAIRNPGDGGAATNASLYSPSGAAVDASGNLFIADQINNRIRKVDVNGIITTVAGNGSKGYSGDGAAATNASLGYPSSVAVDASGNLFIADRINSRIRKVGTNGVITTVAGNGRYGYSGDGGASTNAGLYDPSGVAVDASGNLFIADSGNSVIRKVDTNGIITTVAGNGSYGYSGDGGAATNAYLSAPAGAAVDASGNLFIADYWNGCIRKVDTHGVITTVAGNGSKGYSGDGGAATNASLAQPTGVAVDASGNLFIADQISNRIRKVGTNGVITTVAGDAPFGSSFVSGDGGAATNASLNNPYGVAVDASGNLFISDEGNNRIRKVGTNGVITTVAGGGTKDLGDGGKATNASVSFPYGVAVGVSGKLFISDAGNNRIRKVDVNGIITTVAGSGSSGYSGDGAAATNASLDGPIAVAIDVSGNLFISDAGNHRIRKVDVNGNITTVAGNGLIGYSGDGGAATNAGLNYPQGEAVDASGNLFISDEGNRIRKVDVNGIITTVAGSGSSGYSGDGAAATNASLWDATGVAVDASGNLFISDAGNNRIRKVDVNGIITTVAGNGSSGYSGDGAAATNAGLNYPHGMAVDASGKLFIADASNNRIRKVGTNGLITTVAGNGLIGYSGDGAAATNASLSFPVAVAVDASGNLFISDEGNNRIRKVALGGVPTLSINSVTAASGGGYQVIIISPYGSVTSAVATLTVQPPGQKAVFEMNVPLIVGNNLILGFNVSQGSSAYFTLLQTTSLTGRWTTNTAAVLTTNAQTGGFQFLLPVPGAIEFYQLLSP